jgi:hypothetical protein
MNNLPVGGGPSVVLYNEEVRCFSKIKNPAKNTFTSNYKTTICYNYLI